LAAFTCYHIAIDIDARSQSWRPWRGEAAFAGREQNCLIAGTFAMLARNFNPQSKNPKPQQFLSRLTSLTLNFSFSFERISSGQQSIISSEIGPVLGAEGCSRPMRRCLVPLQPQAQGRIDSYRFQIFLAMPHNRGKRRRSVPSHARKVSAVKRKSAVALQQKVASMDVIIVVYFSG
jgi:hypothetical protein